MTRLAAVLLLLGSGALATGIALIHVPSGVIAAGVLAICGGVLLLDERATDSKGRQ